MEPPVKESPSKSFKKSHSRNLEQTDLILDFLSSLDKSKSSAWVPWQEEINKINADWVRRMDSVEEKNSHSSNTNQHNVMSPSKRVTWSEKLTNIKPISVSPRPTEMLYNLSGKQVRHSFSPPSAERARACQHSENQHNDYTQRLKYQDFHDAPAKLRLMSVVTENL